MELDPKHDLLGIVLTQLFILSIAWAFYIAVKIKDTIPLPDGSAVWVYNNPTETTVVVTIIATIVSSMTVSCFTRAAKHALRQYIGNRRSISLADLRIGVAAASASFIFRSKSRYLGQTAVAFIIATVFGLVNSAWTTFLSPVLIDVLVSMNGKELDLGNPAFDAVLGGDMNNTFGFSNGALVTMPVTSNALTSYAFAAGSTIAGVYATGQPNSLNFNSVSYNMSTGGILPAVLGYGGIANTTSTSTSGTPASFSSGSYTAILKPSSGLVGLSSTYNVIQQGLTANVSCYNYTDPAAWYPIEVQNIPVSATIDMSGNVTGIVPFVNTTLPRMSCNRDIGEVGMTASTAAVNLNNSNFLGSVACPFRWQDALGAQRIVVYHAGVGKYASLPPTICEIVPLLTRSSVTYAKKLITTVPQSTTAIPSQHNLNFWVTLFIQQGEWGFQNARVNSLGNLLLSLTTSGVSFFSDTPVQGHQKILEAYWKGAIEILGSALRSGYAAYPQNVTSMQIPMSGTQDISTMGWVFHGGGRSYSLVPITLAAFMTFGAAAYAFYEIYRSEKRQGRQNSRTAEDDPQKGQLSRLVVPRSAIKTFDASDPIHLIVASAAQQQSPTLPTAHGSRYWEQHENERVNIQLDDMSRI